MLSGVKTVLSDDRLLLTGSDLDTTIQVVVTVAGDTDGVAVLPARLAADIVRALDPGAVHVEVHETEARIASGRSHFSVRLLPADDFPQVPDAPADEVTSTPPPWSTPCARSSLRPATTTPGPS